MALFPSPAASREQQNSSRGSVQLLWLSCGEGSELGTLVGTEPILTAAWVRDHSTVPVCLGVLPLGITAGSVPSSKFMNVCVWAGITWQTRIVLSPVSAHK